MSMKGSLHERTEKPDLKVEVKLGIQETDKRNNKLVVLGGIRWFRGSNRDILVLGYIGEVRGLHFSMLNALSNSLTYRC